MKIEIKSTEIKSRSGVSSKTGKSYTMREQNGFVVLESEVYPIRVVISLAPEQVAYPPGVYQVQESSFFVDRYQKLAIGRLDLKPIAATRAA